MAEREFRVAHVRAEASRSPLARWRDDIYVPPRVVAQLGYGEAVIDVEIVMVERGTRADPVVRSFALKIHSTPLYAEPNPDVEPERDKRTVTPDDIHVPFASMVEAVLAPVALRRVVGPDGVPTYERITPDLDGAPIAPLPRRRRTRIDDALLERVANAYNAAIDDPDETRGPAQIVAETVTYPDGDPPKGGTVGRWIRAAKNAGLIDEGR